MLLSIRVEAELAEERTEDHGTTPSQPRRSDRATTSIGFKALVNKFLHLHKTHARGSTKYLERSNKMDDYEIRKFPINVIFTTFGHSAKADAFSCYSSKEDQIMIKYGAPWTTWVDHGPVWGIGGQKESNGVVEVGGKGANHHLEPLLPDRATRDPEWYTRIPDLRLTVRILSVIFM
ncbi:hypothetical protein LXL04_032404 [Taraxacum kok-saghyz]